jgi:hypothetical protein
MAGAGAAVVLAETVAAVTAFCASTAWGLSGFAVSRAVYGIAVFVGIAAMFD